MLAKHRNAGTGKKRLTWPTRALGPPQSGGNREVSKGCPQPYKGTAGGQESAHSRAGIDALSDKKRRALGQERARTGYRRHGQERAPLASGGAGGLHAGVVKLKRKGAHRRSGTRPHKASAGPRRPVGLTSCPWPPDPCQRPRRPAPACPPPQPPWSGTDPRWTPRSAARSGSPWPGPRCRWQACSRTRRWRR